MGTPAQNFRFHIDTGSSDLWTNTDSSQICQQVPNASSGNIPCSVSGTYNANKSSTYKYVNSDFSIKYADGTGASGDYVTDVLNIGGQTVQNQQFGVGYQSTSAEGVMGIGYSALEAIVQDSTTASVAPYSNVPQSMKEQGLINSNAYSLWLDTIDSATGNILFGGVDTAKYSGSLVTMDIVRENGAFLEMLVTLDDVSVNTNGAKQSALNNSTIVLLDSGSTLSYLPIDAATVIYNAFNVEYSKQLGLGFVSCALAESTDSMSFVFGGKEISILMSDMVIEGGISQSFDCTFGIVPQSSSQRGQQTAPFTLGDSFIRNAYIVYDIDNNQISLAQTARNATGTNIIEIATGTDGVPDVSGTAAPAASNIGSGTGAVANNGNAGASSSGIAAPTAAPAMAAWAGVAGASLFLAAAL